MSSFEANPNLIEEIALSPEYRAWLGSVAQLVETEAKVNAPYKTGYLRMSIGSELVGTGSDMIAVVYADAEYAADVEFGTDPHEIRPRAKKALAFVIDGNEVVVAKVMHPGTEPQPFLRPSLQLINGLR